MAGPRAPRVSHSRESVLRAGPLSATLDGPDLIDVRWGSLDVASRIQVTVREAGWGTVPARLCSSSIGRSVDGFHAEMSAIHDEGGVEFSWDGRIEANSRGELTFAIEGVAEGWFEYRRIGICVLHPWRAYTGASYRATTPSDEMRGTFPREIAPQLLRHGHYQPMIEAFSALDVGFPGGAGAAFAFEGELFELEDQRNWTDASFKTYPTPLARSEPRPARAGERFAQRVALCLEGPPSASLPIDGVTAVRIGARTGRPMPPIGLIAPGDPALHPAHLRVAVDVAGGDTAELEGAASAGIPLEIALLVDENVGGIDAIAPILSDAPLARVLIHRSDGRTISGALVRSVAERLGAVVGRVPIVGGTPDHFSELNRHPPDRESAEAVAFAISPTVHTSDERSMMETLEIQGQVVRRAVELSSGLPVVVSPVRLDAHSGTPFADTWTAGSIAALTTAGAVSLTYQEATPALDRAMAWQGAELLDVAPSHPGRVAALATHAGVLLANLTPSPQRVTIDGDEEPTLAPYEVRIR